LTVPPCATIVGEDAAEHGEKDSKVLMW